MKEDNNIAISINSVSKCYKYYKAPVDMFAEAITRKKKHEKKWALSKISLDIPRGEVVGILGRNGAGKSTLLKILAGTLDATEGSTTINGKLSAVLELGTGFHPEYTGRENIIMGGMCLGMSKSEISEKMEEIIAFSELEAVIDHPFKTYSSGMQGRLTFSTAMCIRPDIFIVDEALATGDALFQEKCMTRLKEICQSGSTVLLVTHSLSHIYEVCTSALLLHEGRLLQQGSVKEVGMLYEKLLSNERGSRIEVTSNKQESKQTDSSTTSHRDYSQFQNTCLESGDGIDLQDLSFLDMQGQPVKELCQNLHYTCRIQYLFRQDIDNLNLGFRAQRDTGIVLFGDTTYEKGVKISSKKGEIKVVNFKFKCRYAPGSYLIRAGATEVRQNQKIITRLFSDTPILISIKNHTPINGLVDMESLIEVESYEQN
ncbi:ABC transporter ATP-binding protein [Spongorhabdus nitratireducens]